MKKYSCQICKKDFSKQKLFPLSFVRTAILQTAKNNYENVDENGYVCNDDLQKLRSLHLEEILKKNIGELSNLDKIVLDSFKEHELITQNVNKNFEKKLTFGQKLADKVAHFGGSWGFITIFLAFLIIWMLYNSFMILHKSFDPYPYILLNLILSSLAAIQAPIIMMSQNRQAQKDRLQSDDDYKTNLKAELEIRQLHTKIDQFMNNQWNTLIEIQQMQIDIAEEALKITQKNSNKKKT